jgi:hypothetical protein
MYFITENYNEKTMYLWYSSHVLERKGLLLNVFEGNLSKYRTTINFLHFFSIIHAGTGIYCRLNEGIYMYIKCTTKLFSTSYPFNIIYPSDYLYNSFLFGLQL